MSTPLISKPTAKDEPKVIDPTREVGDLPEQEFWEQYNKRLEFPLATVAAVLLHVLIAALLIFVLVRLMGKEDRSNVPLKLVPEMGGLDDEGSGQAGSGGQTDPLKEGKPSSLGQDIALPDPNQMLDMKEKIRDAIKIDDAAGELPPISPRNVKAYSDLDKALLDKLMNQGARKGAGPGAGTGSDASQGAGPGGTGASSTRARSLRWVMRFRTSDGSDYVAQLAGLGAVILVPLPPDNKDCLYFPDLKNPSNHRRATDSDLSGLAGQIKFSDTRPDSVRGVCGALGVTEPARSFWAFFPKGLEDQLAAKETGYRNRRPEDIEETVFRVIVRGGSYEIVVDDQTPKR